MQMSLLCHCQVSFYFIFPSSKKLEAYATFVSGLLLDYILCL